MPAPFDHNDASVVVIVGSGAGGGTLGNALALKGIDVVILEAGGGTRPGTSSTTNGTASPSSPGLDKRTDLGRLARGQGLPEPAGLDRQGGRRHDRPTGPAPRCASRSTSSRRRPITARSTAPTCSTGRSTLAEMEPWYAMAEDRMGVTRTNGIPGLPGNNNFKVLEAGAKKLGYKEVHTGRMAINSRAARRARPRACRSASASRAASRAPNGRRSSPRSRRARRPASSKCARHCQVLRIEHDDAGKVTGVVYADKDGKEQRQKARVVAVAGNSIESPRLLLNSPRRSSRTGSPIPRARSGATTCATRPARSTASSTSRCTCIAARPWPASCATRRGTTPSRGFAGGYEFETLSLGLPFMAAFLDPGDWGRDFTDALDDYDNMAGHLDRRRGHAAGGQPHHPASDDKDDFGMPVANVNFDDHPNDIGDARPRLQAGLGDLRRGRRAARPSRRRPIPRPTISAPTG